MTLRDVTRTAARLAALLGGLFAAPAAAEPGDWRGSVDRLSNGIAETLNWRDIGGRSPARIYLRPPFDGLYRVVCEPLSRRIAQDLGFALPAALRRMQRMQAELTDQQETGAGAYILNVSWRRVDRRSFELAAEIGDLGSTGAGVTRFGARPVEIATAELSANELACLGHLEVIDAERDAESRLVVRRSASPFAEELFRVEPGAPYRLLGRMPYAGGWAVVAPADPADDRFTEQAGFARIPDLAPAEPAPPRETAPRSPRQATPPEPGGTPIEVVSGRTTPVCAEGAPLEVRVWRVAGGFRQAVWWVPPGESDAIAIEAGETILLTPTCALRLLRTTRKLNLIAIVEELQ